MCQEILYFRLFFPQPFKNRETILSSWVVSRQVTGALGTGLEGELELWVDTSHGALDLWPCGVWSRALRAQGQGQEPPLPSIRLALKQPTRQELWRWFAQVNEGSWSRGACTVGKSGLIVMPARPLQQHRRELSRHHSPLTFLSQTHYFQYPRPPQGREMCVCGSLSLISLINRAARHKLPDL